MAALFVWFAACTPPDRRGRVEEPGPSGAERLVEDLPAPDSTDWADMIADDTLTALVVNNSTSYFIYRGEAMGFEFRALRAFATDHGLALRVVPVENRTEVLRRLNEGEGDLVAARLVDSPEYEGHVLLTDPLYETHPAVVQRAGEPDRTIFSELIDTLFDPERFQHVDLDHVLPAAQNALRPVLVRSELAGRRVFMPMGSEYVNRLAEIRDPDGETVDVVEIAAARGAEPLIREVARGAIHFTVAPANVAYASEEYFDNVVASPAAGPSRGIVWATRSTSPVLHARLQAWIDENHGEGQYLDELYERYFVDRLGYRERVASEYLTSETGRLSEHDDMLFEYARSLGWDWRLLASQAFQESRFNPRAVSWAGARGILQLMPATARDMGVRNSFDPEQNIQGAVRYLDWLDRRWSRWVPDPEKRLRFVLASYNAGSGHVEDARRIARKYGDDPDSWEDVAFWLLQLSKRKYYRDPVVRFGFVRGLEPVTYVSLILERYGHYREFVAERPEAVAAESDDDVAGAP